MHLGMTGEGIVPQSSMPSPEIRLKRLSTSPEGRGKGKGFSLVELSIVLVILGLLVGGVLSGQSLIRAAALRSVTNDYARYSAAVNTFKDKYFALPGDMNNATAFWGVAHATPATCVTTQGTGTQTCDGNGDGLILPSTGSYEPLRAWQQLASAGLVEGSYSGIVQSAMFVGGGNAPQSKLGQAVWTFYHWGGIWGTSNSGNGINFGAPSAGPANNAPVLKAEDAWNIDTKLDDGKANSGKIYAWRGTAASGCTTGVSPNLVYDLTDAGTNCTIAMLF